MKIIAHRGNTGSRFVENTLPAIESAIDLGVDMIEMDIRMTSDSKLVLFHDPFMYRRTGVSGAIEKKKWEDIQRLKVRNLSHINGDYSIPLFKDALKLLKKKSYMGWLLLDVKSKGIEKELLRILSSSGLKNKSLVVSKDWSIIRRIRMLDEGIKLALEISFPVGNYMHYARKYGVYSLNINKHLLSKNMINFAKENEIKVFVWTVNSRYKTRKLIKEGVDGIITDNPLRLREELNNERSKSR